MSKTFTHYKTRSSDEKLFKNIKNTKLWSSKMVQKYQLWVFPSEPATSQKVRFWTFSKTKKMKKLRKSVFPVVICLQKSLKRTLLGFFWWKLATDLKGEPFPKTQSWLYLKVEISGGGSLFLAIYPSDLLGRPFLISVPDIWEIKKMYKLRSGHELLSWIDGCLHENQ